LYTAITAVAGCNYGSCAQGKMQMKNIQEKEENIFLQNIKEYSRFIHVYSGSVADFKYEK